MTTVQRSTTEDTEIEGVKVPRTHWSTCASGRRTATRRRWERSEEFDIFRKPLPHLSFAAGEHTVPGTAPGAPGDRVALECVLDRLTGFALITDDDPHIDGNPFRSPTALPVTFDPIR